MSHIVSIVLNIDQARADEFEAAFREHELPIWKDMHARGKMKFSALTPLAITTIDPGGVKQYLLTVVLDSFASHNEHDNDPRFKVWDEIAEQFQPEEPYVFGGDSIIELP